jgi:murein DD-endopeptidase MepM/ murein hydrolase activator NlpD
MAKFSFPLTFVPNYMVVGRGYHALRKGKKETHLHKGVDLMAEVGTPVFAVADGIVVDGPFLFAWQYNPPSHAIVVKHGPVTVLYGEIQLEGAKVTGDSVLQGEKIAAVARTGIGSMLHIQVYKGRYVKGKEVDPTPYLSVWRTNLPKEDDAGPRFERDRPDYTSARR